MTVTNEQATPTTRLAAVIAANRAADPGDATGAVIEQLHAELARYRAELVAAGKSDKTIHTYCERAKRFLHWLEGRYDPWGERH